MANISDEDPFPLVNKELPCIVYGVYMYGARHYTDGKKNALMVMFAIVANAILKLPQTYLGISVSRFWLTFTLVPIHI